jgi:hypothetical protein
MELVLEPSMTNFCISSAELPIFVIRGNYASIVSIYSAPRNICQDIISLILSENITYVNICSVINRLRRYWWKLGKWRKRRVT